ncbi:hypothetical protein UlMin_034284 [Ulmus minor]
MESDDEVLFSAPQEASSPVRERKLKRLKKAIRVSQDPQLKKSDSGSLSPEDHSKFEAINFEESNDLLRSSSGSEEFDGRNVLDSGFTGLDPEDGGPGAKRVLDFDMVGDDPGETGEDRREPMQEEIGGRDRREEMGEEIGGRDRREEMGEEIGGRDRREEVGEESGGEDGREEVGEESGGEDGREEMREESGDATMEGLEKKRHHVSDDIEEDKDKKKKMKINDEKPKETSTNKRKAGKERKDYLKELHAESQRLLRETRDASFKPLPTVQKPISSVLEKIRQRKREISKKSGITSGTFSIDSFDDVPKVVSMDHDREGACILEREDNKVSIAATKETIASPSEKESTIDGLYKDESNDSLTHMDSENVPDKMAVDEGLKPAFRAPIDDTQELFSDSQTSDEKNDQPDETPSSPLEEEFVPSVLAMNLKLDSAPPDDDISSDEEDHDKENINPHRGSPDLPSSPAGDPVKAFVDDEAEEEDDSDNDLQRFKDNDEEEDEDLEELNDMIATGYEENPIDSERRNELHQKWLEQQDAAGTDHLMQKLNHGSKFRDTTLLEEQDVSIEEDEESGDEAAEDFAPSTDVVRMNLRKVKQMIPQMFTDNNDEYLSSDDEETDKRLARQCLLEKAEEKITFLSPAEDESSKEIFGLIKKLNIVPDTKKRAKTNAYLEMRLVGGHGNISSKSSFLGRGSSNCVPLSKKQGSTSRSFIFGRDDSNSRSSLSMDEDSSETIQRENPPKAGPAKFSSSQTKTSSQTSSTVKKSSTSLFEILKRTSLKSTRCTVDTRAVVQTESALASFKLARKPVKSEDKGRH